MFVLNYNTNAQKKREHEGWKPVLETRKKSIEIPTFDGHIIIYYDDF